VSAVYLQQFPSYSNHNCKKSSFLRTPAFIFVCPGDAPVAVTQNVEYLPNGKAYGLQIWYTGWGRRPVSATGTMTSKIKGQGRKVTWSVWAVLAQCCTCVIRVWRGHTVSAEPGVHTSLFSVSVCECVCVRACQHYNFWTVWDLIITFYGSNIWSKARKNLKTAAFQCNAARGWWFNVCDVLVIFEHTLYMKPEYLPGVVWERICGNRISGGNFYVCYVYDALDSCRGPKDNADEDTANNCMLTEFITLLPFWIMLLH